MRVVRVGPQLSTKTRCILITIPLSECANELLKKNLLRLTGSFTSANALESAMISSKGSSSNIGARAVLLVGSHSTTGATVVLAAQVTTSMSPKISLYLNKRRTWFIKHTMIHKVSSGSSELVEALIRDQHLAEGLISV